jgi:hypothetical protein
LSYGCEQYARIPIDPRRTTNLPLQTVDLIILYIFISAIKVRTERKRDGKKKKLTVHCHGAPALRKTYGKGKALHYGQPRKQNNVIPFWSTHIYL